MRHSWNEEQGRGIMADRFDLDAIDADDALLDLLAAGGESARTAGAHDPAVKLLAELRLAVEVEDELPVETIDDPESFLARCAALNPVMDPFARKMATRGLALGVAAVAALSVSGVAAAVTGDPLSPYEKVIEKMVDAVRPQTSFPQEQLDGMPVVDKTKIVKVAKDFQKKQEARQAAEDQKAAQDPLAIPPASIENLVTPPPQYARPPLAEKPMVIEDPVAPTTEPTTAPEQVDEGTTDEKPVDEPTSDPTTTEPTTAPSSDPTAPTTEPTDPATTPPAEPSSSDPTTAPTTPPQPNTGEAGSGEPGTSPTTDPTTVPGGDTGSSDEGSNTGESGDDQSTEEQLPADDTNAPAEDTQPADDTKPPAEEIKPPAEDTPPAAEQKAPPADEKPSDSPLDGVADLVEKVVPVLPTPTGAPVEVPSAGQFFGRELKPEAKHSSGKVSTGSVRKTYAKGKHSSGTYAEGKHAAIARAHGSTDSSNVLKILGVVNKPTK